MKKARETADSENTRFIPEREQAIVVKNMQQSKPLSIFPLFSVRFTGIFILLLFLFLVSKDVQASVTNPANLIVIPSSWLIAEESNGQQVIHEINLMNNRYAVVFYYVFVDQMYVKVPVVGKYNSSDNLILIQDQNELRSVVLYSLLAYDSTGGRLTPTNSQRFFDKALYFEDAAADSDPSQANTSIALFASGKFLFNIGLSNLFPALAPNSISTLLGNTLDLGTYLTDIYKVAFTDVSVDSNYLKHALRIHNLVSPSALSIVDPSSQQPILS